MLGNDDDDPFLTMPDQASTSKVVVRFPFRALTLLHIYIYIYPTDSPPLPTPTALQPSQHAAQQFYRSLNFAVLPLASVWARVFDSALGWHTTVSARGSYSSWVVGESVVYRARINFGREVSASRPDVMRRMLSSR